jgi:hypothetical protein
VCVCVCVCMYLPECGQSTVTEGGELGEEGADLCVCVYVCVCVCMHIYKYTILP